MVEITRFEGRDNIDDYILEIDSVSIVEFVPPESVSGQATEVHMDINIGGLDDVKFTMRFTGHEAISHIIEALTFHRDHVWPRTRAQRRRKR